MRAISYYLSLLMIMAMSWKGIVDVPGIGTPTRLIGILVAAFWLVSVMAEGRFRGIAPFHVVAFLFFLWNVVSLLWTADAEMTLRRAKTYCQMAVLMVILWDLFTTRAAIRAGLQAYVLGLWVPIVVTILNFLSGTQVAYGRYAAGDVVNRTAVTIALGVPLAWHLATSIDRARWAQLQKLINYVFISAAVLAICLTATRFALLMIVPSFVYAVATLTRLRLGARVAVFTLLIATVSAVLIIVPESCLDRLASVGDEVASGDLTGRTGYWKHGIEVWFERPIIGIGGAAFETAVIPIFGRARSVHNSFIAVLAELGLVGFTLFSIILGFAALHIWQQPTWEFRFWMTVGVVWTLGNMALSWVSNQPTWVLLSLLASSAAMSRQPD